MMIAFDNLFFFFDQTSFSIFSFKQFIFKDFDLH